MLRAAAVARFPAWLAAKRPWPVTAQARVAVAGADARSPLLKAVPESRACFCSKATAGSGSEAASSTEEGAESAGSEEGEGEKEKATSAIVPPPHPEDCDTVRALLRPALSCLHSVPFIR